jgi:S-(hydroxymethyl)glutathione dehydrogenase/alcohol dehydrogenase
MPDGSSRFSKDGKKIFHNMGCSTLSEYSVISSISAIRIDPLCDVKEIMLLGCGVSTGWGVVLNTCKV